jgi:hypothetical protein
MRISYYNWELCVRHHPEGPSAWPRTSMEFSVRYNANMSDKTDRKWELCLETGMFCAFSS